MAWHFWPFNIFRKKRRYARFFYNLEGRDMIIEVEVVSESPEAYRLQWIQDGHVLKDSWILKNDSRILDIDGEESLVLKKDGNVVILPPRRK